MKSRNCLWLGCSNTVGLENSLESWFLGFAPPAGSSVKVPLVKTGLKNMFKDPQRLRGRRQPTRRSVADQCVHLLASDTTSQLAAATGLT